MSEDLLVGITDLHWKQVIMMGVSGVMVYLAIARRYEPLLLIPISMGILLANLPGTGLLDEGGLLDLLKQVGLDNELFYMDKTMMVFGDAKKVVEDMGKAIE